MLGLEHCMLFKIYVVLFLCIYSSEFSSDHNKTIAKRLVKESKAHLADVTSSTIQR